MLDALVVIVSSLICLDGVAIFLIARVLGSFERAYTKVDLLAQLVSRTDFPSGASPMLRVTSACPVPVIVDGIDIVAERADRKKSAKESFERSWFTVAPFSTSQIDLEEVLEPICRRLGVPDETTTVKFWAIVHHRAYGKRFSTESLPQSGLVFEERLVWSRPVEAIEALHRLSWEADGIVP